MTVVIPENHGYQVIHRLQMGRNGREFGNEFRYRNGSLDLSVDAGQPRLGRRLPRGRPAQVAQGWAPADPRHTAAEVRAALDETRGTRARSCSSCRWCRTSTYPAGTCGGTSPPPRSRKTRPSSARAPTTRPGCPRSSGSVDRFAAARNTYILKTSERQNSSSITNRRIGAGLISVGWMGQLHTRAYRHAVVYPELGIKSAW